MPKFTDTKGRDWEVELNGYTLPKVHRDCGVWLTDLPNIEATEGDQSLIERLFKQPYELLVSVLYSLCERQVDERKIGVDDFAAGLFGDSLSNAMEALAATVVDFFPDQGQRLAIAEWLKISKETAAILQTEALNALQKVDRNSLAKIITASSSNAAANAELTPIGAD
jgi:hypothetical protein